MRTIIVETASRFARDLIVAEMGFRRLRAAGIALIAADAPNSFLDDTPTSAFIRQAEERGNRRQRGRGCCNEACMVQWSPLSGKLDLRRAWVIY